MTVTATTSVPAPATACATLRISQIILSLEEQHGGPSKSVLSLSLALGRLGHNVELLATRATAPETRTRDHVRIREFLRDRPQRLGASAGLNEALRLSDSEIVHHHGLWLRTLHYAHRQSAARGATFVVSPRGMMSPWAWRHHRRRKQIAQWLIHPGAFAAVDGWHATSEDEAAEIRALGFPQPVCVAPNGVDAPTAESVDLAVGYWRDACPEIKTRPVALFYSRLHRKKRVLELIDAWLEHGPRDWLLLVVGIPEDYTPQQLETYVQRSSGAGRVRVFDGVGRPQPYAIASLFLLPSHSENFGLVIAEALAHAVPAVVTDTTPWRDLNDHGGWCVPWTGFPAAVRSATAESADDLRARGRSARDWAVAAFSWDRSAQKLTEFYRELQGRP